MQKTFSFIFCFISISAAAQSLQKMNADLMVSDAGTRYNDTSAHVQVIDFRMQFNLAKLKKSWLSGSFNVLHEGFSQFPVAYGSGLTGLTAGLSWNKRLGDHHVLVLSGTVAVYSDFHVLSSNAIREGFGFTYFTRYSKTLALGLGVQYVNQFYGNQLLPVIVIVYTLKDNPHWKISGYFPYNPKITYAVNANSGISFGIRQVFSSFLLSAPVNAGDYIKNRKLTTLLNYEYNLDKHWRINAGAGYVVQQKYQLYNNKDSGEWWLLNTPLGHNPAPVQSISHGGIQFNIGIAFNPKF
ncbi:MAG: DUF6268 family outer membrane beta-barrel protein [Puia sp.]|nr:DUF6268 family outer membrane beta-barrel protein [Puia sp.]